MEKVTCTKCEKENNTNAKYCSGCGYELQNRNINTQETDLQINDTVIPLKRKRQWGRIFGALAFVITCIIVQHIFFAAPSFDKILLKTSSEINKMCPVMVDQYTRWDNTAALPNNTFVYNYTLINLAKSEVNLDTARKYVLPGLINRVKTEPDLKMFRDKNVTMIYSYHDKNGVFVVKYSITPSMYK